MAPAKKCRIDSGTSTVAVTSTGGGSQHSTATTSLLFADAGYYDKELKRHLIAKPRQELDESVREEIKEVVEEFEPDIYVVPTLIKTTKNRLAGGCKRLGQRVHGIYSAAESQCIVVRSLRWMFDHLATVNTLQATGTEAFSCEDSEMRTR